MVETSRPGPYIYIEAWVRRHHLCTHIQPPLNIPRAIMGMEHVTGKKETIARQEYQRILRVCRKLPPPRGNYHVQDYVENLLLTVLDYRLGTAIVTKAIAHFRGAHANRLRCYDDLIAFLATFPGTLQGNVDAAVALWGYKYGRRVEQLRKLAGFLASVGVTDQPALVEWAQRNDYVTLVNYDQHFAGKVKGLGFAVYQCLLLRVGVETVKPAVHVLAFV